jgi:small subunit ribosomal protein S9
MATQTAPKKFYLGTGRRKTAVARVRLAEGTGKIVINGRGLNEYFTEDKDRAAVVGPLQLAEMSSKLDVFVNAKGGGFTGQAGAICQGIARALKAMFGLDTAGPRLPRTGPRPAAAGSASGCATPAS